MGELNTEAIEINSEDCTRELIQVNSISKQRSRVQRGSSQVVHAHYPGSNPDSLVSELCDLGRRLTFSGPQCMNL